MIITSVDTFHVKFPISLGGEAIAAARQMQSLDLMLIEEPEF